MCLNVCIWCGLRGAALVLWQSGAARGGGAGVAAAASTDTSSSAGETFDGLAFLEEQDRILAAAAAVRRVQREEMFGRVLASMGGAREEGT